MEYTFRDKFFGKIKLIVVEEEHIFSLKMEVEEYEQNSGFVLTLFNGNKRTAESVLTMYKERLEMENN